MIHIKPGAPETEQPNEETTTANSKSFGGQRQNKERKRTNKKKHLENYRNSHKFGEFVGKNNVTNQLCNKTNIKCDRNRAVTERARTTNRKIG